MHLVLFLIVSILVRTIKPGVIFGCSNDAHQGGKLRDGYETLQLITIPEEFMSNFESTEFSVESLQQLECDMNYEVIKINLIGSPDPNMEINSSKIHMPPIAGQYEDNDFNENASFRYDPFFDSRNGSHFEVFMSSFENITAISDTSYDSNEEELQCDRKLSRKEVHFSPSGFLFYFGEFYRTTEYCIQSFDKANKTISIRKCRINCKSKTSPCIALCCHLHEYVDLKIPCCQTTLEESKPMFQPVIYDGIRRLPFPTDHIDLNNSLSYTDHPDVSNAKSTGQDIVRPHFVTFKYHEVCPDGLAPLYFFFNDVGESNMNTRIHIQNTGQLAFLGRDRNWNFLEVENYCVAGIVNLDHFNDAEGMERMNSFIKYCHITPHVEVPHGSEWSYYLYIGTFCVSAFFLLLTVVVYLLLWDRQNIHGWTILSFVTSEFFLFLFLSISYIVGVSMLDQDDKTSRSVYCLGSAILAHFFFIGTFSWKLETVDLVFKAISHNGTKLYDSKLSWLTIINLDLWWTFKSLTPLSERSKGRKRFTFYMIFAWGIPLTVVTTGLTLQQIYDRPDSFVLVPDYGNQRCFLASHAEGVYLYYIIGALLFANFTLISLTFITIYRFKKSTRVASASSSKAKEQSFKLFVKLVMVMGITWSLEFFLWFKNDDETISWLRIPIDLFNILQSVATFLIFVCKRKILNQLELKHPSLRVITRPLLNLMTSRASAHATSTDGKSTRTTAVGSSSVLQQSRKSMQRSSVADSKL